jgi:RNA polymerase sigma factor (sigma-70 family)
MGTGLKPMPTSSLNRVIQHLRADLRPDGSEMTDAELLARFLRSGDEDALAPLVRRHARMVWGVCRRLLSHHDAEDAFQATFLVLVRKVAEVPRQAVANWLYGVARQTAVRVRATAAKRDRRETKVVTMPETTVALVRDAELPAVLDEEVSRLPDHYREVVLLCDLEGLTRKQAARQLGVPEGSVASRLARARVMLAKRLTRRGVVLSGASVAAVLSAGSASASAPPALVASTIKAARLLATGKAAGVVSAKVAALTEGMVKAMFVTKLKSVLGLALVIATLVGAAGLIYQTHAAGLPEAKEEQLFAERDQNTGDEKEPAQAKQPAKSDEERIVGSWVIVNEDSGRKGETWDISKDGIIMVPTDSGVKILHFHRLDASKTPKHIDIFPGGADNPPPVKGIYLLDGDELRMCVSDKGKDRPAIFPEKPGRGEVLILRRKTDQERIVGSWVIVNEDSNRKGEPWSINKDTLVMHTNYKYYNYRGYWINPPAFVYRLDAGKTPKQIDIGVAKDSVRIKGIYVLDGDELRLCLAQPGKNRPAAFPEKPAPGEVLVLQRQKPAAEQPKAQGEAPAAKKVLTPEEAIKQMPKENVTVQFKVASVEVDGPYTGFPVTYNIDLKDGGKFTARLTDNAFTPLDVHMKKLGIEGVNDFKGKMVRVTGRVEGSGDTLMMWVPDHANFEVVKE